MTTEPENQLQNEENEVNSEQEGGFKLPDPDMDNVTVLTDNLPKNPILPWRNYDSPWEDTEKEKESEESENENQPSTD